MKKFDKVNPVVVAKNENNNKLDLLSKVLIKENYNNIIIQNNPTIHIINFFQLKTLFYGNHYYLNFFYSGGWRAFQSHNLSHSDDTRYQPPILFTS